MEEKPPTKGSMTTLIDDLLRKPRDPFREELIGHALAGRYHDFKSSHATPKVLLVHDLKRVGFDDIARRAMRGEYDDAPDTDDHVSALRFWHSLTPSQQQDMAALYERIFGEKPPVDDAEWLK